MSASTAVGPRSHIDPLLALTLLGLLAGALACALFEAELAALRRWGAAELYLLALPGAAALARWAQLRVARPSPQMAGRARPRRSAAQVFARRRRTPRGPRRLAASLAAALLLPR